MSDHALALVFRWLSLWLVWLSPQLPAPRLVLLMAIVFMGLSELSLWLERRSVGRS